MRAHGQTSARYILCAPPPPPPPSVAIWLKPRSTRLLPTAVERPLLLCLERLAMSMAGGEVCGEGAARRRRERRLRWQSVAMALAEQKHHASRGQLRARATKVEEQDQHEALRRQKAPPPGKRPGVLKDPEPQGRMGQHCGVGHGLVQALDVPVLQMVEQHVEVLSFFHSSLLAVPGQVIEVPILSLPVCAVQRAILLQPQMAEQLLEVPTPFHIFEQNADSSAWSWCSRRSSRFSSRTGFSSVFPGADR